MKLIKLKSPFWSLLVVALLVGLPCYCSEAQARGGGGGFHGGGGGFHGGGGFSGGSFRGAGGGGGFRPEVQQPGSFHPGGPPSGGPHPGGPPAGGPPPPGPRAGGPPPPPPPPRNITVTGGWGPYYGPGWGAGVATGLAAGAVVTALPYAAERIVIADQPYYVAGGTYYQPCYQGTDVNYCVVPDPTH